MNRLFYGDCLDVLKNSIEDESIDLIYIDPPFNSKRNYNVLFEAIDMSDVKAQKEAFADTWSNIKYIDQLSEIQDLHLDLYNFLYNLDSIAVPKGTVSYLTTMALRIFF
ncbi:MAG: site-specific DNA-methyltransferase, partial [Calditrichota bacterium]